MYYQQKDYLVSYYSITDEQGKIVLLHDLEKQVFSFDPCSAKLGFREPCEPETVAPPPPPTITTATTPTTPFPSPPTPPETLTPPEL
jgi:hypothetical protein